MTRGFWRHQAFMDVYVYVLKIDYYGNGYRKARIEWWNHGYFIGYKQIIKIYNKDLASWVPCDVEGK